MITSLSLGRTSFNVVEFLWINLIMDTLGAVAICTEPYRKDSINESSGNDESKNRVRRQDKVLDGSILRSVLTTSLYQLIVLLTLTYFGVFMFFDETFNLVHGKVRDPETNKPSGLLVLDTIIFHTFVLMSLFNQINCRVINPPNKINIFATLFNNWWFVLIFLIEMGLQNYFIYLAHSDLGSAILGVAPLTMNQQIVAYSLAVFVLILQPIVKLAVPIEPFEKLVPMINIESDLNDNAILRWKNKAE
jgi:Ca2+-transporting ATPase